MISWILVILVVAGLIVFFKTTGIKFGKSWTIFIGSTIFFVVLTFGYVITRPGIDLTSFDGFVHASEVYFVWLGSLFDNAAKVTGYAVNTNWTANVTVGGTG